ncbi:hypothetical protein QTP88_014541 [Uroleucon formosanum]
MIIVVLGEECKRLLEHTRNLGHVQTSCSVTKLPYHFTSAIEEYGGIKLIETRGQQNYFRRSLMPVSIYYDYNDASMVKMLTEKKVRYFSLSSCQNVYNISNVINGTHSKSD